MFSDNISKFKWLNVWQYCKFLKILGHVMVLLVLAFVGFSYYALVFEQYGPIFMEHELLPTLGASIVVIIFSGLVVLLLWSYFACVTTDPGRVPPGWHPFDCDEQARVELDRLQHFASYYDRRDPRRPRYCKRCQAWKPERSHHCSVSGRCVLRMDHYCIWVVNCVGLLNYKFFLLFMLYSFLACTLLVLLSLDSVIKLFTTQSDGSPVVFLALVVDFAFCVSLAGFLIMHAQLVSSNYTTIEMYEKERMFPWPYNRGWKKNFEDIFGRSKLRWFLPLHTRDERRQMLEVALNKRLLLYTPPEDNV